MSSRFSEISNSSWCKTCNVQIMPGETHPNIEAHLEEVAELEKNSSILNKKLNATSTFIPVSSNDMMRHVALVASPETLCGKIIVDKYRPSTTDRVCDVCAELSAEANFVKTEEKAASIAKSASTIKEAVNYTRDGFKIENGFTVITAEEAEILPFLDSSKVRVSRYNCPDCEEKTYFERLASCQGCGEFKCLSCMNSVGNFLGICAKCAGVSDEEILADSFDEPLDNEETFRLVSRLLEEDEEPDEFFLPQDEI